jgi:hypothetical protein
MTGQTILVPPDPVRVQALPIEHPRRHKEKNNLKWGSVTVWRLAGDCGVGLSVKAIQAGLRDELHELGRGTTAEGPDKRCGVSHQDLAL